MTDEKKGKFQDRCASLRRILANPVIQR